MTKPQIFKLLVLSLQCMVCVK